METAPLKSFATSARTELIREVTARITAVLAQGSPERVEQPKAVTALERAIAGAGGGDKGKAHVADKVAYTWFNRIIALRFMDANGYTGIGVVSPAADQVGQPEVLAAAKRGQVDKDVVSKDANLATITGLLNGTRQPRPGVDAQAEAYALLLADYCRFWNTAMPFMFEREGDYTELLIPANLLADDSVLSRSVKVLTEDVCQDVEVIGWLYQFYISERKDEVFAGFKKNKKAGADEIPAATQLFTPHWIVRYLVENSLGRLWMLNRPTSGLASQMDYYIAPVDEETDFLKIAKPEELKVIDPACGSGHMLTYAFDLLYAIYEEEGYAPSEIPGLILANNLYGTEIDPRAGALAAFALTMKAVAKRKLFLKNPVEPNICVLDPISFSPDELDYLVTKDGDRYAEEAFWNQFAEADTLGSLITPDAGLDRSARAPPRDARRRRRHAQGRRHRVGAAGRSARPSTSRRGTRWWSRTRHTWAARNMGPRSRRFAEGAVPASQGGSVRDVHRAMPCAVVATWNRRDGHDAVLDVPARLREVPRLAACMQAPLDACAPGDGGVRHDRRRGRLDCRVRVVHGRSVGMGLSSLGRPRDRKCARLARLRLAARGEALSESGCGQFVLPLSPEHSVDLLGNGCRDRGPQQGPTPQRLIQAREGLTTGSNDLPTSLVRGLDWPNRLWRPVDQDSVSGGRRWFPYQKGGSSRRWYGNFDFVVDWENTASAKSRTSTL